MEIMEEMEGKPGVSRLPNVDSQTNVAD